MKVPSRFATLLTGIVPVIAYAVADQFLGLFWGLVAGMGIGVGECLWEWRAQGRVSAITWGGNVALWILGGVSLATQDGIWFKLQPGILEAVFAGFLLASVVFRRPFLVEMARKQGSFPEQAPGVIQEWVARAMGGITWRLGVFFAVHAALSTYAAFYWSTAAWAALKGIGLTVSMGLYLVVEVVLLRYRIKHLHGKLQARQPEFGDR